MGNFMNVVVGAVVDASVYAFTAQAVIFLFASLDVIFTYPLLEMAQQASNPHQYLRFVLLCPAELSSWSSSFRCCGFIESPKRCRVALGMVDSCSMVNVFFLELFVDVVQILIDSLVRHRKMTSRNHYLPSNACSPGG